MDKMKNKERGVTLLELVVAGAILSLFLSVLYMATSGLTDDISRQRNEVFPSELAHMIKDHYLLNTYEVDSNAGSEYIFSSISIPNRSLSTEVSDSLSSMIQTVPYSNMTFRDGYNQPMLILISERLEQNYEGIQIPYRVFSIVSTGNTDVMDISTFNTTMNVETGVVDAHPDETVVTINTFQEQLNRFKESQEKVERMLRAYSHYYWSRHNLQIGDISRNYFAGGSGQWDNVAGQKVNKTCDSGSPDIIGGYNTPGIRVSLSNFSNALGMSADFERNAWGQPMYIMNCGTINNVLSGGEVNSLSPRNPDNPTRNIQPFNAIIGFTMPNGESYFEVISSRI